MAMQCGRCYRAMILYEESFDWHLFTDRDVDESGAGDMHEYLARRGGKVIEIATLPACFSFQEFADDGTYKCCGECPGDDSYASEDSLSKKVMPKRRHEKAIGITNREGAACKLDRRHIPVDLPAFVRRLLRKVEKWR